jgi:heptosyltransferase-2
MWALARVPTVDGRSRAAAAYNILVIRLDAIGDVVLSTPFLRELRRVYPDARITLLVAPHALNLVETCPYIDRVLSLRLPWPTRLWHPLSRRLTSLSFARGHLWRERYDLAIVPRWGVDRYEAMVIAFLSGARSRVGFAEAAPMGRPTKRRRFDGFLTQVVDDRSVKHEVRRNLDLLSALGMSASEDMLEVWLSEEDEAWAKEIVASQAEPLVALAPGAGSPKRRWPIDRFVAVGRWLEDAGARLVIVGGAGEEQLGRELQRRLRSDVIDLTNKTTLRQCCAILRHCSLFCGNDAGPMHLAAAVRVPVVEISCHSGAGDELHPNSPARFGPWGVPHRIVRPDIPVDGCTTGCTASGPHCILSVQTDSVIAAIESLRDEMLVSGGTANAP